MDIDKIRFILNVLFMLIAVAAVIVYFLSKEDYMMFIYVCGAAVVIKVIEFSTRIMHK